MIEVDKPGRRVLFSGNEALARGALEAGVDFCSSYPGSPCVEVAELLFQTAAERKHYGEWSTNEIVAAEAAAAASFAGLRAVCVMKQNGLAVASDFLLSLNHPGARGGLVIIVGDDPSAHSSINEVDSRHFARFCEVPLLEPSTVEEARDMVSWAFELSEQVETFVIVRVVTRISHARGNLALGKLPPRDEKEISIQPWDRFLCLAPMHGMVHMRQGQAGEHFAASSFNAYQGPPDAESVVIASGPSVFYAREALEILGMENKVGLIKLGTTWPLPGKFLLDHLAKTEHVIIVEETDPFLEQNVSSFLARHGDKAYQFDGQSSGKISGSMGPGLGELNVDLVTRGLAQALEAENPLKQPSTDHLRDILGSSLPERDMTLCPGCPHRSSFWALKTALELDGRKGFALGDIGCYTLGAGKAGFWLLRSVMCMGSGIGLANGFGQLHRFGMEQPVLAVMGDSTFYHACLPALINGVYNRADFTAVILDNSVTAMTGFQPHPGMEFTAMGEKATPVAIEEVTRGIGLKTVVADPHELEQTVEKLFGLMQEKGPKVMILRRECSLQVSRRERKLYQVDAQKCLSEECGCHYFCSRTFGCPAIYLNGEGKAVISDVLCTGCGACALLCPAEAIYDIQETGVSKDGRS